MSRNTDTPVEVEITSVVANFLTWDETGGNYVMLKHGISGLDKILQTRKRFHANHLRNDITVLLGKAAVPQYSHATTTYIDMLFHDFSSPEHVRRLAYIVAFEHHASKMLAALWESLAAQFSINKDELSYFRIHVGGDDPAEPYHVEMTASMIDSIVKTAHEQEMFLQLFSEAYRKNTAWCEAIKQSPEPMLAGLGVADMRT
jgi:hypothetical protein